MKGIGLGWAQGLACAQGSGICMHAQDGGMKQARNGGIVCNTCFRLVVTLRVSAISTWVANVVLLCVFVLSAMSRLELA